MTTSLSAIRFSQRLLGKLALGAFALLPLYACSEATSDTAAHSHAHVHAQPTALEVHKSPTCGCCGAWVTHMEDSGFAPEVHDTDDMNAVKQKLGIDPRLQSCHTTVSGDYFFEGHIPAKYIEQFLQDKPEGAVGLAVPGMPLGSPGMEMNNRFQSYHVMQVNSDGSTEIYATVEDAMDQH